MFNTKKKLLITAIIPIALIICLSAASFASTFSVTSSTRQAITGEVFNVSGGYTVASNGFLFSEKPTAEQTAWSNGAVLTGTDGIAQNHWYYSVTLTAQTGATAGTVSIQWSQNGATYTALGKAVTFYGTPVAGNTAKFLFDTGVGVNTAITAPVTIVVTVS